MRVVGVGVGEGEVGVGVCEGEVGVGVGEGEGEVEWACRIILLVLGGHNITMTSLTSV